MIKDFRNKSVNRDPPFFEKQGMEKKGAPNEVPWDLSGKSKSCVRLGGLHVEFSESVDHVFFTKKFSNFICSFFAEDSDQLFVTRIIVNIESFFTFGTFGQFFDLLNVIERLL